LLAALPVDEPEQSVAVEHVLTAQAGDLLAPEALVGAQQELTSRECC
jgi:hypothetical protein